MPEYDQYQAVKKFQETHKEGYKYAEKYMVEYIELPDGSQRHVLRRRKKNCENGGCIVVSQEQVFEAIDEWHCAKGHMGMECTHNACCQKYFNCTQVLVKTYVETCFVCMQKNPSVRALCGSRKPIVSNHYREQFQVDLIDFQKMRKRDPFGVLMRWIVREKAIKQRGDHLVAKGLGTGAVLSLSVDYRTHSHASGLLAIVYRSNATGAALVGCEHGVITHDGSKKDYWVPSDKFVVIAGEHEDCALTPELQELRDDIKRGNCDYTVQPRISYSKYHALVIGVSSPTKRRTCACKGGCSK